MTFLTIAGNILETALCLLAGGVIYGLIDHCRTKKFKDDKESKYTESLFHIEESVF